MQLKFFLQRLRFDVMYRLSIAIGLGTEDKYFRFVMFYLDILGQITKWSTPPQYKLNRVIIPTKKETLELIIIEK